MTSTRKTTARNTWKPQTWQIDPSTITSSRVQFWQSGIMVTAQMTPAEARQMIENGTAFAICSQAIGALQNGQPNS